MKHEPLFRGSAVALVTPLRGGKVDVEALHRLVEMHVDNGTAAIVACGTPGEPATLTPDERELVIREVVAAARGRVPVICGTGSNCTQTVIDTERRYRSLGCVAQLVVTPYYNKTTQEGLYAHFMAIAEHTAGSVEKFVQMMNDKAKELGIHGKETTPYLLDEIQKITGGDSLEANIRLVYNNARLASAIAVELSR